MRPLVVVEASSAAFEDAIRRLEGDGASVARAWRRDAGVVCAGAVATAEEAAEAVLAVVAGAGVVVHAADADGEVVERLVDDLRRFGVVEHVTEEPAAAPALTADERMLLELLGAGLTLGEAAERLHLSRRTADRRLANARTKLGAATTAEAVVSAAAGRPQRS